VIGFLGSGSFAGERFRVAAFVEGLKGTGFIEGNNINIEWRWAEGEYNRLPSLVGELVSRGVAVIVAFDAPASSAAKAATKNIPIVFTTGADPVKTGLVDSVNRPGSNLTGVFFLASILGPKRLELLRELFPSSTSTIAFLVNPSNPNVVDAPETEAAANAIGRRLEVLKVSTEPDLEAAFTTIRRHGADAARGRASAYRRAAQPSRRSPRPPLGYDAWQARLPRRQGDSTERSSDLSYLAFYPYAELPPARKPADVVLESLSDVPIGTPLEEIKRASDAFGLDFSFMRTVAKIESDFNPKQRTGSYAGLFQLSNAEFTKYGSGEITKAVPGLFESVGFPAGSE
jgi:putative ABC transport system substrate-binding protein